MIIPNWHPIFVHFTVALIFISAVLYMLTLFIKGPLREQWIIVARWSLWFGMGFTAITGLTGLYAYNTVAHDTPSHLAMTEHRNWALATIAVILLVGGFSIVRSRSGKSHRGIFALLMLVAASLVASTAWHGGELVYRYGLGVMSLPKVEGNDHAHGTGEHSHALPEAGMDFSGMDIDDAEKPHEHTGEGEPHNH
jgi:uncharacterized membrane protein